MTTTPTVWKAPTKVNTTDVGGAANDQNAPFVTALTGGRFLVVWLDTTDWSGLGAPDVFGQIYDALGEKLGAELKLNSFTDMPQVHPEVVALGDGGFVLTYQTLAADPLDGTGENVAFDRFDANGAYILTTVHWAANTAADETNPTMVTVGPDSYAVIYESNPNGNLDVKGAIVSGNGTAVGAEFTVRAGANDSRTPEAALLGNGNFVVAYAQDSGAASEVDLSIRSAAGVLVLDTNVGAGAGLQTDPKVTALLGGGFVVAWTDAAGDGAGNSGIMAQIFSDAGVPAVVPFHVNTTTAGAQSHPSINKLGDGGFVVVWVDAPSGEAHGQRGLGTEFIAAAHNSVSQPSVTPIGDGRFVTAFTDTNAGNDDVWMTISDPRTSPVSGTGQDDVLTSRIEGATVFGNGGNDQLFGQGGNDILFGGPGNNTMHGGAGDDWYFVSAAGDVLDEPAGQGNLDRVFAGTSYTLTAAASIEIFSTDDHAGTAAIDLTGNELANIIYGNAGVNTLNGLDGADTLVGLGAGDQLNGGNGDDILSGGSGNDALNGDADNDRLYGGSGQDTLNGGTGNDWYFIDDAQAIIVEPAGDPGDRVFTHVSYTLTAGAAIEIMSTDDHGGVAAINLTGNELANIIAGNAGANVIAGRAGNDAMLGMGGADTFLFDTAPNAATNVDRIVDFAVADDLIHLDDAIFATLAIGALPAAAFFQGPAAHDADDRLVYDAATGALYYDPDGSNATPQTQFASLAPALLLTEASFFVV